VLVVQGPSIKFNPQLTPERIAQEMRDDPEGNAAEWQAEFRSDLSAFLADELIEDAIQHARPLELPPRRGQFGYKAFVDPSGGRHDHFAVCIGHQEGPNRYVADVIRGTGPPFDPQSVVKDYTGLLKQYGIGNVVGDNYSAEWAVSAFAGNGISYVHSDVSKSQLYLEALPLFARGSVAIPNHQRLIRELRSLERATHRSGRDTIDHPRGGSDDYANCLVGMLNALHSTRYDESLSWVCDDDDLRLLGRMPVIAW
jgi:hypothetical protein